MIPETLGRVSPGVHRPAHHGIAIFLRLSARICNVARVTGRHLTFAMVTQTTVGRAGRLPPRDGRSATGFVWNLAIGLQARSLLAFATVAPGCAINGVGVARSDVIQAKGAVIVRTDTYGVALRTTATDAGLTIGYTSTLAMIPACPGLPHVGHYLFGLDVSGISAVVTLRRAIGIGIDANKRAVGMTMGFSEDAMTSPIDQDKSALRSLIFLPGRPSESELRLFGEAAPCQ
jgi:hypothetical protein